MRKALLICPVVAFAALAVWALVLSPSEPAAGATLRLPTARTPVEAAPAVPHTIVPILERRFGKVEADLTARELVFTRLTAEGGVHGIIEQRGGDGCMRQTGLWFYRDPVRRPLPGGLSTVAIRKDADMSIAFIYPMEDDVIVKSIE
jgi:hypothetical protein